MKKILAMILSFLALSGCGLFMGKIPAETLIDPVGVTSEADTTTYETTTTAETTVAETTTAETTSASSNEKESDTQEICSGVPLYTEAANVSAETVTTSATEEKPVSNNSTENMNNSFNAAFFKAAVEEKDNIVVSPLSLKIVLNMSAVGTGDGSATQSEILELLGYESMNELKTDSGNLVSELNREDGSITLNNSYWVADIAEPLNVEYVKETYDIFSADSFTADLSSEQFVKDINAWIEEKTNGMIKDMLNEPMDENARLVLVNTLYFKNKWQSEFMPWGTYEQDFYGNNGTETVDMMHQGTLDLDYGEGEQLESVVMPYRDGSVMNIYMPKNDNEQLGDILEGMSSADLERELSICRENKKVDLAMPKFECDYKESLVDMLKALGMNEAFDPTNADFSGICEEQLYISQIIQAAKIICDEKGTEASAATMAEMLAGCAPMMEQPIQFTVDRPFMYEIKSESGETLFMGIIQNFN